MLVGPLGAASDPQPYIDMGFDSYAYGDTAYVTFYNTLNHSVFMDRWWIENMDGTVVDNGSTFTDYVSEVRWHFQWKYVVDLDPGQYVMKINYAGTYNGPEMGVAVSEPFRVCLITGWVCVA